MTAAALALASSTGDVTSQLAAVAQSLRRVTVEIRGRGPGSGSGVIWRADGRIVTNAHVVRGSRATVELWDGRSLDARVTLRAPEHDLVALAIEVDDLAAAPIGDAGALRPGDLVLALGHPFGVVGALALGVVHAVDNKDGSTGPRWIRADIRLAPGNSGGPLADARGRVVGINTMIAGGLGVAVPAAVVARFLDAPTRPRLGVIARRVALRSPEGARSAVLVLEVEPRGPAAESGVLAGDVIAALDGRTVASADDITDALAAARAGGRLRVDLVRAGKRVTVELVGPGTEAAEGGAVRAA